MLPQEFMTGLSRKDQAWWLTGLEAIGDAAGIHSENVSEADARKQKQDKRATAEERQRQRERGKDWRKMMAGFGR